MKKGKISPMPEGVFSSCQAVGCGNYATKLTQTRKGGLNNGNTIRNQYMCDRHLALFQAHHEIVDDLGSYGEKVTIPQSVEYDEHGNATVIMGSVADAIIEKVDTRPGNRRGRPKGAKNRKGC